MPAAIGGCHRGVFQGSILKDMCRWGAVPERPDIDFLAVPLNASGTARHGDDPQASAGAGGTVPVSGGAAEERYDPVLLFCHAQHFLPASGAQHVTAACSASQRSRGLQLAGRGDRRTRRMSSASTGALAQ
jgi:hypothetical protein